MWSPDDRQSPLAGSSRQDRPPGHQLRSTQMKTKPRPRPPAIWGRRAWQAYLAANPSRAQSGKRLLAMLGVGDSQSGADSPDLTATLWIRP